MFYIVFLAVFFLFISLIFSMFGLGGGLAYVSLLVLVGYTVKTASIISLFAILLASFSAFSIFFKSGRFDWKLAALIDPPTDIMAFVGGYYANLLPEIVLTVILVAMVLLAGMLTIRRVEFKHAGKGGKFVWRRSFKGEVYTVNIPLTCLMTGVVGFFVGMIGATGGIFKIPIMVLLCGVPIEIAVGTSSGMVFLTALFALIGHLTTAKIVDWLTIIPVGVACLLGGIIGARISIKARRETIRNTYGVLMFIIAVIIVVRKLITL